MLTDSSIFLATEKTGGLFDLDGTLALVAIQFLILMFILNSILYTPLLDLIETRNKYVAENLTTASNYIIKAEQLKKNYESQIGFVKTKAQAHLNQDRIEREKLIEEQLAICDTLVTVFSGLALKSFEGRKQEAITQLQTEIESISDQIITKLLA